MNDQPEKIELTPEIWGLVLDNGRLVCAIDEIGNPFLAFRSLRDAEAGRRSQLDMWDGDSTPVLLHPKGTP